MRFTENRYGKIVIPRRYQDAAREKLAKYEDTGHEPHQVEVLIEREKWLSQELGKWDRARKRICHYLNEIDGQIMEDPVSEIRDAIEEMFSGCL